MLSKKISKYRFLAVLGVIIFLSVVLRFYFLDARTVHIDEGMSLRAGQIMADGHWRYDPYNAHGPVFFFLAGFVYKVFGDDWNLARATMSVVSVVWLVVLGFIYWPLLKKPGRLMLVAGLGLSSGMAFFSRYFIHEHLFILITVGALAAGEWWVRKKDPRAPAAFVIMSGLMYATKETAVLTWAAWFVAALLLLLEPKRRSFLYGIDWRAVALGIYVAAVLHVLLFTVFFMNSMQSVVDSFVGLFRWSQRAQAMHVRPFPYFIELLAWHEFPVFFGAFALGWFMKIKKLWTPRLMFFALWSVFIVLAYSMIQYKTPWNIPNLILPFGIFTAFAFDAAWPVLKKNQKKIVAVLAAILLIAGFIRAWRDSMVHPDRVRPLDYAYLQGDYSFRRFMRTLEDLNALYEPKPISIQRIGNTDELLYVLTKPYQSFDSFDPFMPGLPVYINYMRDDRDTLMRLKAGSGKNYIRSTYRYLRDWGHLVDLFVEENLWNRYLKEVAHEEILPGENPVYDYSD
ncbi:hypothetical protein A3J34_01555 [Candidatus Peribacteria bacterium RIFCSPLOWO2_02_FULL_51_10]|nr:MAG: hypothetical protein A3J34_01555 [Candidatus Peribacteria bacterium RIFCSPLOWO2_02_FULL_51_10]